MTSSLFRGRPRRVPAHVRVRVARALAGAVAGGGWLVSPVMTVGAQDPVPAGPAAAAASAAAPGEDGAAATDLVLPLFAVGAAGVLAGYGYLRRARRARTRTTPGVVSPAPPVPTVAQAERQARAALVLADDCVRASGEELPFVAARFGEREVEPYARALGGAGAELASAFALWRRYGEGLPKDTGARRQALAGVVGRCAEAGRLLDAGAEGLDRLRGLEHGVREALEVAEGRFRELAARTVAARATVAALRARYAASAGAPVAGYAEQAEDRIVFATSQLNGARQSADAGDGRRAARHLRAAEGAVAQAGVLVDGVERLAARLREAAGLVPAALTGAEAEIAAVRGGRAPASPSAGELHARLAHADGVLAAVREELTGGRYDPLDALRRITRAVRRLEAGRPGVLEAATRLVARSAVGAAEDYVTVHRAAVGAEARTLLAEAVRALGPCDGAGDVRVWARALRTRPARTARAPGPRDDEADVWAGRARESAERDVRGHGGPRADPDGRTAGLDGAVLGGILLAQEPDGGPPVSFGGPRARGRRRLPAP
ncbi:hypothetical protein QQY24_10900 [Streptomyces sp. TG1A-8]|uniref:hypothetical protein n=1 Tax=Streptomyces sp. TG1A-8 TaxID=3051385 RepID=UPI00265C2AD9|nr:hypothetical protein [Streptomyces sp. TG1A-8]MDO0925905.1 hypothetical protein [Streptomyces sp. TG1A-8]